MLIRCSVPKCDKNEHKSKFLPKCAQYFNIFSYDSLCYVRVKQREFEIYFPAHLQYKSLDPFSLRENTRDEREVETACVKIGLEKTP